MSLISDSNNGSSSSPLPLLMVVEYLETPMSTDLLGKFPDNSAFDFDYQQSSIWSPLLPPPPPPPDSADDRHLQLSGRKLSYDGNDCQFMGLLENTRKMALKMKRKFTESVPDINISRWSKTMKRRKRKSFGFSPAGSSRRWSSSSSSSPKAWAKVMKAAAKHFKKRKNKKKGHNENLDLSNCFKYRNKF